MKFITLIAFLFLSSVANAASVRVSNNSSDTIIVAAFVNDCSGGMAYGCSPRIDGFSRINPYSTSTVYTGNEFGSVFLSIHTSGWGYEYAPWDRETHVLDSYNCYRSPYGGHSSSFTHIYCDVELEECPP